MCFDEDGLVNNSWVLQIKMVVQNVWKWTEKMSKFFATPTFDAKHSYAYSVSKKEEIVGVILI